ncbi:Golgi-associated plant pathogenesis-related protein 1-like [Megachile rotundata]|uniref:Golgi-associated plant pathogenesis-related protein 1-like n=1 Tax=Megachile rotundata TaxID=143995 RepID=UPI003FCFD3D8
MENFPENFVLAFLQLHNQYRAKHDAPPLQIDEKLNEYAQEWADSLAENGILEYRPETKYGENVYRSTWKKTERDLKPTNPLEEWLDSFLSIAL